MKKECCSNTNEILEKSYETIKLEKAGNVCSGCEEFAESQLNNEIPYSIISCEGACLRGEVSRQVANNICFDEMPEKTSRICLGGAFTKDTGQRKLVRNAKKVIVLEGCAIKCASRMMNAVIDNLETEIIPVDKYYDFDRSLFAINEVSEQEIKQYAKTATGKIIEEINGKCCSESTDCC